MLQSTAKAPSATNALPSFKEVNRHAILPLQASSDAALLLTMLICPENVISCERMWVKHGSYARR